MPKGIGQSKVALKQQRQQKQGGSSVAKRPSLGIKKPLGLTLGKHAFDDEPETPAVAEAEVIKPKPQEQPPPQAPIVKVEPVKEVKPEI